MNSVLQQTLVASESIWNRHVACGGSFGAARPDQRTLNLQQTRCFIQMQTRLTVADNSGAKVVGCIRVLEGGQGRVGDTLIATVKEVNSLKKTRLNAPKVKKGQIVRCVVVRAAMQKRRQDGTLLRFDENAVVVINKENDPVGTRVFGPVAAELREKKFGKIISLAEHVV